MVARGRVKREEPMVRIPRASLWSVVEVALEYRLYELPSYAEPVVLDIGANVGIFAINAAQRWPGAKVWSYEPHPVSFRLLGDNTDGLDVMCRQAAVMGDPAPVTTVLHEGARNRLCCSTIDRGDQDMTPGAALTVPAQPAALLEPCDVLKVDTEGVEVAILTAYPHLRRVKALLVEVHAQADVEPIKKLAQDAGLLLVNSVQHTLRFVR